MRLIDADVLKKVFVRADDDQYYTIEVKNVIDNSPSVEAYTKDDMTNEYLKGYNDCKDIIQPKGEWIEIKHRLNLLLGVLYTNQLISDSDLDYIEDSIKKLMKGEEE